MSNGFISNIFLSGIFIYLIYFISLHSLTVNVVKKLYFLLMLTPRTSSIFSLIFKKKSSLYQYCNRNHILKKFCLFFEKFLSANNWNEMGNHTPKCQKCRNESTSRKCFPVSFFSSSFKLTVGPFKAVHFCFLAVVSAVLGLLVDLLPFSFFVICFRPEAQLRFLLPTHGSGQGKANCSLTTRLTKE